MSSHRFTLTNVLFSLAFFGAALIAGPATAAGSQSVLYVDPGARGRHDGSSWRDAFPELQPALDAATSDVAVEMIFVAEGTYRPEDLGPEDSFFSLPADVRLYGGFPAGGGSFELRDPERYHSVLSGDIGIPGDDSDNAGVVLWVKGANTVLDGFSITGARGVCGLLSQSGFTLTRCTLSDNEGQYGAMFLQVTSVGSTVSISQATFSDNRSTRYGGGAIVSGGSDLRISRCRFIDNSSSQHGGAIASVSGQLSVTSSLFLRNRAQGDGAAIYVDRGTAQLTNLTVVDNQSPSAGAAAIQGAQLAGLSRLANSILWQNSPQQVAGFEDSRLHHNCIEGIGPNAQENFSADPRFVDEDLRISLSSPCLDTGSRYFLPGYAERTDLDGARRITTPFQYPDEDVNWNRQRSIDIGAYEVQPVRLRDARAALRR